jgi:hypothetical protein
MYTILELYRGLISCHPLALTETFWDQVAVIKQILQMKWIAIRVKKSQLVMDRS